MSSLGSLGGLAASEHDEEVAKEELAVRVLFELERVPDVKYDWGGWVGLTVPIRRSGRPFPC